MCVAYILVAFAVIFFILGLVGYPFPLGNGLKRRQKHQDTDGAEIALPPGTGSFTSTKPVISSHTRSQSPESLDLLSGEGVRQFSLFDMAESPSVMRQSAPKHSWCAKCGFPFPRPQSKATCNVDRPGENWCARRRRTSRAERLRRMVENPNTQYRVHPEWKPDLVPDADDSAATGG